MGENSLKHYYPTQYYNFITVFLNFNGGRKQYKHCKE